MNKIHRVITGKSVIFLLLLPLSAFAQERLSSVIKQIQPSVVTITIQDEAGRAIRQGSGFFVNESGHIITNRHVVEDAIRAGIKTAEGKAYSVTRVLAEDKEGDLIRLSVDLGGDIVKPLRLSRNVPELGERLLVIGSPLGLEQTVSEGIVSAIRGSGRLIQITAPISPGSSGSPVVNMKGEVIGVATLQFTEGQNLNFAVSAEGISKLKPGVGKALALWTAGLYGEGIDLLEQKNYRATVEVFEKFLKQNPGSKYAASAQYLIGEAYYALGQYRRAFEAFWKVYKQYPDSEMVPVSLRMAAASEAQEGGPKFSALTTVSILLDKYPQSKEVIKAREMLREWGKESNPYVGRKGFLGNVRKVKLTINSNDVLMKCANPGWAATPHAVSAWPCQEGAALFMQDGNLKSMILDTFRRRLPSVVIDAPLSIGIVRGYIPEAEDMIRIVSVKEWVPVSVYVGFTVEKGNIEYFGVTALTVLRRLNLSWRVGPAPANEQSEELGMVRYFSGSRQTIHAAK